MLLTDQWGDKIKYPSRDQTIFLLSTESGLLFPAQPQSVNRRGSQTLNNSFSLKEFPGRSGKFPKKGGFWAKSWRTNKSVPDKIIGDGLSLQKKHTCEWYWGSWGDASCVAYMGIGEECYWTQNMSFFPPGKEGAGLECHTKEFCLILGQSCVLGGVDWDFPSCWLKLRSHVWRKYTVEH